MSTVQTPMSSLAAAHLTAAIHGCHFTDGPLVVPGLLDETPEGPFVARPFNENPTEFRRFVERYAVRDNPSRLDTRWGPVSTACSNNDGGFELFLDQDAKTVTDVSFARFSVLPASKDYVELRARRIHTEVAQGFQIDQWASMKVSRNHHVRGLPLINGVSTISILAAFPFLLATNILRGAAICSSLCDPVKNNEAVNTPKTALWIADELSRELFGHRDGTKHVGIRLSARLRGQESGGWISADRDGHLHKPDFSRLVRRALKKGVSIETPMKVYGFSSMRNDLGLVPRASVTFLPPGIVAFTPWGVPLIEVSQTTMFSGRGTEPFSYVVGDLLAAAKQMRPDLFQPVTP